MAGMPKYELIVSEDTSAIYLCLYSGPTGRTDASVTCQSDDVTEKCIHAVFSHLVISADKAGTDEVTMFLTDLTGRDWMLTLSSTEARRLGYASDSPQVDTE